MYKIISAILIFTLIFASGCGEEKQDKQVKNEYKTEYETFTFGHRSLRDEYTWLNQIQEKEGDTYKFNNITIQGESYNEEMTVEEFIKEGWYIQEYSTLYTEKYKPKEDVISGIDEGNFEELEKKSMEQLDIMNELTVDTVRMMMYYPEAQDIIYIIVCREEGETWRESRICGYEYYWNMSKEDSFNINGITQYTTQEELDKMLLTSDEDIVKAEYDNQGYIDAVYYTNKSGKDGIRIKYNYRINYSATEPYEKIITVSVRS